MIAAITEVWTPLSVAIALVAGAVVGFLLVGRYAADPAYASGKAAPAEYAVLTGILTVSVGLVFYGGQVLTSYVGGDTEWTRVVSRFGIWVMYAIAIAIGTWIRIHHHLATRRHLIHERAVAELEETKP